MKKFFKTALLVTSLVALSNTDLKNNSNHTSKDNYPVYQVRSVTCEYPW